MAADLDVDALGEVADITLNGEVADDAFSSGT